MNEEIEISTIAKTYEYNGFTILVGRSAEKNDILTCEIANNNDMWLHASGVPGSHVIIMVDDDQPSRDTIKYAAKLAAKNSKGKGKIDVVYTSVINVEKTSKHNTGQVSIDQSKANIIKVYGK